MLTLAFDVLAERKQPDTARILPEVLYELIDGQSADISFEKRQDIELAECVRMAVGKNGRRDIFKGPVIIHSVVE